MSCGVGHRCGSDPALLWLWRRPVATAPIRPLAWEPSYAAGVALEKAKRQKKKKIATFSKCASSYPAIPLYINYSLSQKHERRKHIWCVPKEPKGPFPCYFLPTGFWTPPPGSIFTQYHHWSEHWELMAWEGYRSTLKSAGLSRTLPAPSPPASRQNQATNQSCDSSWDSSVEAGF